MNDVVGFLAGFVVGLAVIGACAYGCGYLRERLAIRRRRQP